MSEHEKHFAAAPEQPATDKTQASKTMTELPPQAGGVSKYSFTLLLMIDTSERMKGARIDTVNAALKELMAEFPNMDEQDIESKVAILTFSDDCHWLTPMPMAPSMLPLRAIQAGGSTMLGAACKELNRRMNRQDLFALSCSGLYAPTIVFMLGSEPTDDYMAELQKLRKNKWYAAASKVAIPIGNDVDEKALVAFTGDKEAVLKPALAPDSLIKKIKKMVWEISFCGWLTPCTIPAQRMMASSRPPSNSKETPTTITAENDGW